MGCVREAPQIEKKKKEKKRQHGMCKRNSPQKNKVSTVCVRETLQIKKKDIMGCVRETPHIKTKAARDV